MNERHLLIVGAPRCGTTTLYRYMEQHPDVLMSRPKETHFFDVHYDRGLNHYRRAHFQRGPGECVAGEATPTYLFVPFVAERIACTLPGALIVALLRDPVERAHSHWWAFRVRGLEPLSFAQAVRWELDDRDGDDALAGEEGARRWAQHRASMQAGQGVVVRSYVAMGEYAQQLRRYHERFPRERVLTFLLEDLEHDPERVVRTVWRALGVDEGHPIREVGDRNASLDPRVAPFARLVRRARLNRVVRAVPERARWRLKRAAMDARRKPPMDEPTRALLTRHFEPHDAALSDLLGVDVRHWRARRSPRESARGE